MERIKHFVYDYLLEIGVSNTVAVYLNMLILLILLFIVVFIVDYVIRKVLRNVFSVLAGRTKSNFDDIMIKNKVPRNIAHIIPFVVAYKFVPMVFSDFPYWESLLEKGLMK